MNNVIIRIQKLEYQQARQIIVFTVIGFLLWGFIITHIQTELVDSFASRLLVALVGLLSVILGKKYQHDARTPSWMILAVATSMVLQVVLSGQMNDWPIVYLVVSFCIFIFTFLHLTDKIALRIWSFAFLAFAPFVSLQNLAHFPPAFALIIAGVLAILLTTSASYRRRIFSELRESEEKGNKILQSMQEGVLIFAEDGSLSSANEAACNILNLSTAQIAMMTTASLLKDSYREDGSRLNEERNLILQTQTSLQVFKNELIKFPKTDFFNIWLSISSAPLLHQEQRAGPCTVIVTFQDVTLLKEKEGTIRDQERMLSVKGRFNALGEMASGIAHEINNPLAILAGRVEQIRRIIINNSSEPQITVILNKIDDTIKRISRIISSMKSLSREGSNDPFENSKLSVIVEDTIVLLKEKLEGSGIVVKIEIDPQLEFECRPAQISQVLLNLLHNAKDALVPVADKWIHISASEIAEQIVLRVTDSGEGIPDVVRKKIMQPFFTTKEIGKGTGLGLSITSSIIRAHQGEFILDEKSANTSFLICIPKQQKRAHLAS